MKGGTVDLVTGIVGSQARPTGSFDRSVIFHTPIKSCQKCSLRLILAEKSSLVHDI